MVLLRQQFVYAQTVDVDNEAARIAGAIGEPARARILYSLMDNRARTSTELAMVAGVSPSTASVHLSRLKAARLVHVLIQGKHHYYRLEGPDVAAALESLGVLAGHSRSDFVPTTPSRLRTLRSCYDHVAGKLGVLLHDCFLNRRWLVAGEESYHLTAEGQIALRSLGINTQEVQRRRRRFAFACLDWSERRPHLGGALGAALLTLALDNNWLVRDLDSRCLSVTRLGRRQLLAKFGVEAE